MRGARLDAELPLRPRRARIVTWMKRPSEICSTTCARASSIPTKPSPCSVGFRSPISASRASTTTARSGPGLPEAIYGPGKTPEQCVAIVGELLAAGTRPVLLTRVDDDQAAAALAAHPDRPSRQQRRSCGTRSTADRREQVLVVTAGTSDLPVADECAAVLDAHGVAAARITDAGVAGVHRLLVHTDELSRADVVVVVAGMEGALASVVGGLTPAPVIAVPTSVGYGAALPGDHRAPRDARVVRGGRHRRRHRQRLRCRVRRAPAVHRPRPRTIDAHVTTVAWFHCFSGIAGDMALGSLDRRGRRPRRGARDLQPHPGRWMEARGRAGHARRRRRDARHRAHRGERRRAHRGAHRRLDRRGAASRSGARARARHLRRARTRRRTPAPAATRAGPLPRGGRARRDRRRRRHVRGARAPRRRRGALEPGRERRRDGARRARPAARTPRLRSSSCCGALPPSVSTSPPSSRRRPARPCSRRTSPAGDRCRR